MYGLDELGGPASFRRDDSPAAATTGRILMHAPCPRQANKAVAGALVPAFLLAINPRTLPLRAGFLLIAIRMLPKPFFLGSYNVINRHNTATSHPLCAI
jgi:hypothetical protein